MSAEPEPEPDDGPSEYERCVQRRRDEAKAAGLTLVEARLFAESDTDIGLLRKLVDAGCPVPVMARILI